MRCGNGEAHEEHTVHEMFNNDPSTVRTHTCEGVPWEVVIDYAGVRARILSGDQATIMAFNIEDPRNIFLTTAMARALADLELVLTKRHISLGIVTIDLRR